MVLGRENDGETRFLRFVEGLASVIGHADRVGPLHDYCLGLMVARGRQSVEPMAAHIAPHRTSAQHQSMLHFVGSAGWSDEKVPAKVREMVQPQIERHGPIEAWIIDDTGLPLYSWDQDWVYRHTDVFPVLTRDGKLVITEKAQNSSIAIMDPDGSNRKRIFQANDHGLDPAKLARDTAGAFNPTVSPDGKWIAFG